VLLSWVFFGYFCPENTHFFLNRLKSTALKKTQQRAKKNVKKSSKKLYLCANSPPPSIWAILECFWHFFKENFNLEIKKIKNCWKI
jgi:hypothetical protein